MKKQPACSFKEYVETSLNQLRTAILHGEYLMDIAYSDKQLVEPSEENETELETHAKILIDTTYLNFKITIYPSCKTYWDEGDYEKLGNVLLHEICHLLTQPQKFFAAQFLRGDECDLNMEINERQTQRIANVINFLLPKEWYLPKNVHSKQFSKKLE